MALLLAAGVYIYKSANPVQLEFVELSSPQGFRELAGKGKTSPFNPIFGGVDEGANAGSGNAGKPDTSAVCRALLQDAQSPVIGDPDSPVSIVEFFDYRCPFCKTLAKMLPEIEESTGARIIYKEWPILGESSQLAARAAMAADKQGKYLALHARLMKAGFIPTLGYIKELSGKLGIDTAQLLTDMQSDELGEALQRNHVLAKELGLVGTPVLVVGRTIVRGAISKDQLVRLVMLEKTSPPLC